MNPYADKTTSWKMSFRVEAETGVGKQKEIFHSLFHCPDSHCGWGMARPVSGASSNLPRAPSIWAILPCFPRPLASYYLKAIFEINHVFTRDSDLHYSLCWKTHTQTALQNIFTKYSTKEKNYITCYSEKMLLSTFVFLAQNAGFQLIHWTQLSKKQCLSVSNMPSPFQRCELSTLAIKVELLPPQMLDIFEELSENEKR